MAAAVPLALTGAGAVLPAKAQSDDPQQLCIGPDSTVDDRVKGCSAVIDSGQVHGRELAAAYAQRGFAFTLKRALDQAQKDLDQAIKIAPTMRRAMSIAPISGPFPTSPNALWLMPKAGFGSSRICHSLFSSVLVRNQSSASTTAP